MAPRKFEWSPSRLVAELAGLASTATRAEFRREALRALARAAGFDFGVIWAPAPQDVAEVLGPTRFVTDYSAGREAYVPTVGRLMAAAAANGGVVEDNELFDAPTRERLPLYRDLGGMLQARQHLTVCLSVGGSCVSQMYLARTGARTRPFGATPAALVRGLVPVLALGEAALAAAASPAPEGLDELTPCELQVLELFALGATYDETARALGVSANTVREYVRSSYRKLHVASKTEAAMCLRARRSPRG